jgi:hypothetical protein
VNAGVGNVCGGESLGEDSRPRQWAERKLCCFLLKPLPLILTAPKVRSCSVNLVPPVVIAVAGPYFLNKFSNACRASFGRKLAGVEVSFSGHANLKQRALIARILLRDSLLHRLHALKPAARIEIRTLLAGMQLKLTFRTPTAGRHSLQQGAALRAP